jgi:catechol 2,3-dioxygenase-like lactoylglutathione lyase family enzyme
MAIVSIVPQLRTTDFDASIDFYTNKLGMAVAFRYQDFYAGLCFGTQTFHLKHVDERDPSIDYVDEGGHLHLYFATDDIGAVAAMLRANGVPFVRDVHDTDWSTRELVIRDDQGHTLYFGQPL